MRGNSFIIRVDFRENDSIVEEILSREYAVRVIRGILKVGDYIINDDIVIERKTTLDFAKSIIDGRLFRQAGKMKELFDCSFFVVEGNNLYNTSINIHPHAVRGALVSIALVWQIPVFFSEDARETALLLWLIGNQRTLAYNELSYRRGRRPKQLRRRQIYILQGLPHVGPKLAVRLLDRFGSVEAVIAASEKELMLVQGLGKAKAVKIKKVISRDFSNVLPR